MKYFFTFLFLFASFSIFSQKILDHKDKIRVVCLQELNTKYRECNLCLTPDGRYLFFMSMRGGLEWSVPRRVFGITQYDGNIWFSKKVNDIWQAPNVVNLPVNSRDNEDEPNVSPDGQKVYFQSWKDGWENNGGPYYVAQLNGDIWETPKGLSDSINRCFVDTMRTFLENATDGIAVSPDGKRFIVAMYHKYEEPMDIYQSSQDKNGKWGKFKRLSISTKNDERSVFLAADGKTLYFASNGYGGFGKLDIFKTTLNPDGTHGEILNIGKPFNTAEDDYGFVLNAAGTEAYFIRNGDIYFADLTEANLQIRPIPTKIISGKITDSEGKPQKSEIIFYGKDSFAISTAQSNSLTGEYSLVSPCTSGNFRLEIIFNGKEKFNVPVSFTNSDKFEEVKIEFQKPIAKPILTAQKDSLTLKKLEFFVYFDSDKDFLKSEFCDSIRKNISKIAKTNIERVDLQGHTDNDADSVYNYNLGIRRCRSVSNFLEKEFSIIPKSMESFSESQPKATNISESGKKQNRRVKISVFYR